MDKPDRRSRAAVAIALIASGVGWFVLPYAPGRMVGELPERLLLFQQIFAWWPLSVPAAYAIGLALPHAAGRKALRWTLLVLQWLLTLASVALIIAVLFEVFFPRPY
ncbi:MAG TPA: hypothetical protein VK753_12930 [Xanthomonadaceae bacterium]|jgi:hypothetical protein|nr:hypothetical protein [Xanthomonadaceae bacterium]